MQGEERSHRADLTPAERELEEALRALSPTASTIDRDRLLFDAGAASVRDRSWRWGFVAAALALGLTLSVLWRQPPRVVERLAQQPARTTRAVQVAQAAPAQAQAVATSKPSLVVREYHPVPIPVPTGPFVAAPPRFVKVSRVELVSDARGSAYFTAIQNVFERGLGAIPSTRTAPGDRGPAPRSGDVPAPEATSNPS